MDFVLGRGSDRRRPRGYSGSKPAGAGLAGFSSGFLSCLPIVIFSSKTVELVSLKP
jgi:hypothetical protein